MLAKISCFMRVCLSSLMGTSTCYFLEHRIALPSVVAEPLMVFDLLAHRNLLDRLQMFV